MPEKLTNTNISCNFTINSSIKQELLNIKQLL